MGADDWRRSGGREMAGLYPGMLARAGFSPGMRLLDVGTGRGELVRLAAERGAAAAVGVDYSPEAVELANTTIASSDAGTDTRVLVADARKLPFADSSFDLITMLDVVEHLTPHELRAALIEARRVLASGGRIFVHTAPSKLIYEPTYRALRMTRRRRRHWPADPRTDYEREMHVNEQRAGTLRRALRAAAYDDVAVELGEWVRCEFVPDEKARRTYRRLARVPGLRRFAIADLYAHGTKR